MTDAQLMGQYSRLVQPCRKCGKREEMAIEPGLCEGCLHARKLMAELNEEESLRPHRAATGEINPGWAEKACKGCKAVKLLEVDRGYCQDCLEAVWWRKQQLLNAQMLLPIAGFLVVGFLSMIVVRALLFVEVMSAGATIRDFAFTVVLSAAALVIWHAMKKVRRDWKKLEAQGVNQDQVMFSYLEICLTVASAIYEHVRLWLTRPR